MGWLVLIVCIVLYVLSFYLHPLMACRKCKGRGRFYGAVHRSKFRFCHACGNTGRKTRPGATALMSLGLMKYGAERSGSYGWVRRNRRG